MRTWSFMLLDSRDQPLGLLDGEISGTGEVVALSALGGSASLRLAHRQDIDWMRDRVQVIFEETAVGADGARRVLQRWAAGTYLFASPDEYHSDTGLEFEVGLLTKMNILAEDAPGERFDFPAGTQIIPAVVDLIRSTGETRIAVTESDQVLLSDRSYSPEMSKLEVINKLLEAAGYWSLWCDGSGQFRVEPYIDPARRPIAHRFEHGEAALHMPDWQRSQNLADVPNRYLAIGPEEEDGTVLIGRAENNDPGSPFSAQNRGTPDAPRWITHREEGVEGETQAIMTAHAERGLRDLMNPVSHISVEHDLIHLEQNDLVEFIPEDGVRRLATVQRMEFDFTFDSNIRAEWRQVDA